MATNLLVQRRPGVWTIVDPNPPFRGVLVDGLIPDWDDRDQPDDGILRPIEGW